MSCLTGSHVHATSSPVPPEADHQKENPCVQITIPHQVQEEPESTEGADAVVDYMARAQWLRAAVLGANDGLVSVASLMVGVGAVNESAKAMLASGLAGLVAGACSMAIGEFVSVYAQCEMEAAEMKRTRRGRDRVDREEDVEEEINIQPSPAMSAAAASAASFALGAALPLLAGGFIARPWGVRVGVVCGASSVGLAGFGAAGAVLGGAGANLARSALRVLVGGWLAMLVTYGVLRIAGLVFNMQVISSA